MTKEEREREIARLSQWVLDMEDMMEEDGTVPSNMRKTYEKSLSETKARMYDLKREGTR